MKIFSGSSSGKLTERVCDLLETTPGAVQVLRFSEGNTFVRIGEPVKNDQVYIIQTVGLDANNQFMELLFLVDALRRADAGFITVVMPFFSYAKSDKSEEAGVSIRARVCADALEGAGANRVITIDLHSPQVEGFFRIPLDHLHARHVLAEFLSKRKIPDLVVVSPDSGYAKSARKISELLQCETVICDKTRKGHAEDARILEVIGSVAGKNAVIVDDFSISFGTIAETAKALKERGARDIVAMITHPLLSTAGLRKFDESVVSELITTDTVAHPGIAGHQKITVVSVAGLIAEAVRANTARAADR